MDLFKLQQALCPVSDPQSEVNDCFGIIDTEQGNSNNSNVKVVDRKGRNVGPKKKASRKDGKAPSAIGTGTSVRSRG